MFLLTAMKAFMKAILTLLQSKATIRGSSSQTVVVNTRVIVITAIYTRAVLILTSTVCNFRVANAEMGR